MHSSNKLSKLMENTKEHSDIKSEIVKGHTQTNILPTKCNCICISFLAISMLCAQNLCALGNLT